MLPVLYYIFWQLAVARWFFFFAYSYTEIKYRNILDAAVGIQLLDIKPNFKTIVSQIWKQFVYRSSSGVTFDVLSSQLKWEEFFNPFNGIFDIRSAFERVLTMTIVFDNIQRPIDQYKRIHARVFVTISYMMIRETTKVNFCLQGNLYTHICE